MRVLVTGATGFIGSFLADRLLREEGADLVLTGTGERRPPLWSPDAEASFVPLDVRDRRRVFELVTRTRPDVVYHLAAVADPAAAWRDEGRTFEVNVLGTIHLLDALAATGTRPRVFVAASSAAYGRQPHGPIPETHPQDPLTPYGTSKLAQELVARQHPSRSGLEVVRGRIFNTIGPGEAPSAVTRWAKGIVALEKEGGGVLGVGELSMTRDFTDVRDQARAILAVTARGAPGEAYNLCSGEGVTMQEVLDVMLAHARAPVRAQRDPAIARPVDEPVIWGDPSKLRAKTGHVPQVPLARTLADALRYARGEPVVDA